MLFHATHIQGQDRANGHSREASEALRRIINGAGGDGVKVQGVYANGPERTLFLLLEADRDDQLDRFLDPIRELGQVEVVQVCDGRACLKR